MSLSSILIVLIILLKCAIAGNVKYINFQMDYSNIGLARKLFFTFQLDTYFPNSGYMQIQLPFDQATLPTGYIYQSSAQTCNSQNFPIVQIPITIEGAVAGANNVYWIDFPQDLSNQNVYTLVIVLSAPVGSGVFNNPLIQFRPVSITTYSSLNKANPSTLLIYDTNPVFTMINFEAQVASSLNTQVLSGGSGNLQSSSIVVVRLKPTQQQIRRVDISLPQSVGISFDNSDPTTFCQVATLILNQDFTCQQSAQNEVLITFSSDLQNQNYDISLKINFPTFNDNSDVQVVGMRAGDNVVMEWNTIANAVSTIVPSWTSRQIFGFQNQLLSSSVCVYRGSSATDYTYNTLKFTFQVSQDLLAGINYRLAMDLTVDSSILDNSIVVQNLVSFSPTQQIKCYSINSNSKVQCDNVQNLKAGTVYSIQLRVSLVYISGATANQFKSGFGKLEIYPFQNNQYYTKPSVLFETNANLAALVNNLCIQNNFNWLNQITANNINDYQVVHSRSDGSIATPISTYGIFGVKVGTNQILQFYNEFISNDFNGTPNSKSQLQISANYRIIAPQSSSTCMTTGTPYTCNFIAPASGDPYQIVKFQFAFQVDADAAAFIAGAGSVISFDAIDVKAMSSVQPSDNFNSDYIFKIIPDTTNPTNNVKTAIVNGFVLPTNLYTDINISLVNLWTGTTNGNDANLVPTFIRINVFFSSNQPTVTQGNWIVFFDNVNFLPDPKVQSNPSCSITQTSTVCGYQAGNQNSYHYLFQNYFTYTSSIPQMPSIDQSFTVLIPVTTTANKNQIRVRTALLDTSGNIQGLSKQYQFQFKAAGVTQQAIISDYNTLQNTNFEGLNFLFNVGSNLVGDTVSSAKVNVVAADFQKILNPNSATQQGTGITITSTHNLVSDPGFDVQDGGFGLISSKPQEKCIKFGYLYSDKTGRYGFYCPLKSTVGQSTLTSYLNVLNLSLPWETGTSMPNIVGTFSNNVPIQDPGFDVTGILLKYTVDNTLNAMQPNVLKSIITDIDLPISQRFVKLSVTFTTTNQLPSQFNFVITSQNGSSQPFLFTVSQIVLCQIYQQNANGLFTLVTQSCKQIFREFQIIIQVSNGSKSLSAGTYKIRIGGINVIDNPLMRQQAYFETQTITGKTIDKTPNPYAIYYNFKQKQLSLSITNQSFLIPNKYAMTIFSFTFTVQGRAIYSDEEIIFNLDAFSVDNNINTPICRVIDPITQNISPLWNSCYFNGKFSLLTLTPIGDISNLDQNGVLMNSFIVQIQNIRVPRTPVQQYYISGYVYNIQDQSQPILYQQNIPLPGRQDEKTIQQFTQLVLQNKKFNTVGSLSQFQFSIKPTQSFLDYNSMILIYLPSYYPPLPDFAQPVCYIQLIDVTSNQPNTFTRCEYLQDRMIVIRDIFPTLQVNYAYQVTVSGIPQPLFTAAQTIFIALIQKYYDITSTVNEYLEVLDIAPNNPNANIVRVSAFSKTKTTWIQQDNYVFTLRVSNNVAANSYLAVDFPSEWVDKNQNKPAITCYLQQASSANVAFPCSQNGYRIIGQVASPITANTDYTLIINGFSNPHYSLCIGQGVTVQIADSQMNQVTQRSYVTIMNIGNLVFDQGLTSDTIFKWQLITNDNVQDGEQTYSTIPSLLTVYIGTYSRRLRLSVADGNRIANDFSLQLQSTPSGQTPFSTYPTIINMSVGDYYVDIRIGAQNTVTPGIYSIYFQLNNGGQYNIPPVVKVQILSTSYGIPNPSINNIVVPILGYSLPIYWNMDAAVPISQFKLETDIAIYPDLVLDYKAYSDMTFSITKTSDFITLKSDAAPIVSDTTSKVNLYIDPSYKNYFQLIYNTVLITLVQTNTQKPQTIISISNNLCTSVTFTLSSNQPTLVYYQIQLASSQLQFNFNNTVEQVRILTQYQFDDVDQVQYGMFPVYLANTVYKLTIPNLFSQRSYSVQFFPINENQVLGDTQQFSVVPKSNLDYLIKTKLYTTAILSTQHMVYLACQHSYMFLYPYKRVRSIYEDYCDPKVTSASLPQVQTATQQQVYYFYLYPFEYIELVEQAGTVYASASLKNNQISAFKTKFTSIFSALGLPVLDDFQYGGKVIIYPPVFTSQGQVTSTKNSLVVTGITLQNNGIIFAILERLNISIKGRIQYVSEPTFLQVRSGLNNTDQVALGKAHAVYEGTPITFEFDNLEPGNHYRVVMYATSEDPSQYKMVTTNVTSVEITLPAHSIILLSQYSLLALILITIFS
ncbi:hypothetical protein TTHERM_00941550 (macronuclear) [Tetrahymena thermophila SB210]|uniref:Transmembrane protein n=1 Tax=Tetrahymena thermophila (strain SB210) TaxID=312017 RepID=Q24FU0_TETTS|nr:hypothetical protein TTHERM_00941550 [Tetrahymena thermophila SB210]EAS06670.3 hypothetical protein TTHERM_00941550 [Tetrahymena thermophila SB210]|eukprot:XP_001026915.3 hypothetical protein TTHERM_00941550 [Tetrahymena thermophila SB210]